MTYAIQVLIFTEVYFLIALSVDFLYSDVGVLSFAQAAYSGVGAYSFALLQSHTTWSPINLAITAIVISAAIASIAGTAYSGLPTDFVILATIGLQLTLHAVFQNWASVTRGVRGIAGIEPFSLGAFALDTPQRIAVPSTIAVIGTGLIVQTLRKSRWQSVLHCIRGDESFATSLGIRVTREKRRAAALSAAIAALGGVIYAVSVRFVDPSPFTIVDSTLLVAVAMLGGVRGVMPPPILGAFIFGVVPEILRFVGAGKYAADIRQMVFSVVLILMVMRRSQR